MSSELVLLVDDETALRSALRDILEEHGYAVVEAGDGSGAGSALASHRPDLVVLDLGLPDRNGLDVLREIRERHTVPIIILSGRGEESDRIVGLELGADDYLVKPVSGRELVAHTRALLRRATRPPTDVLDFGELRIDLARREVELHGEAVALTTKEFELLAFVAGSPKRVYSVEQLLLHVWHAEPTWQDPSTVAEHVYRLRRKLGATSDGHPWIETIRNAGYRFQP